MRLPLKDIFVTQPFGVNYLDFYQQWGLKGHNGVDFRAKNGCPAYACFDGKINYCGTDKTGGIQVDIWNRGGKKAIYYHLKDYNVKQGQIVKEGDIIGHCDNTGKYTTGSHLHFGFKNVDKNGYTLNWDNGYNGAIDPAPYFDMAYDGTIISNKDWDKSRAYHRYYRGRPKGGYWIEKYRVVPALIRRWKRLPNNEEINAAVYGGWDVESIENPAMHENWSQLKKTECQKGQIPFT